MKLEGNEVKMSRKERRSISWQRGRKLYIEDIPVLFEVDTNLFNNIVDRMEPRGPVAEKICAQGLARIEKRAKIFREAQEMFVQQQLPEIELGIQRLLEDQQVTL